MLISACGDPSTTGPATVTSELEAGTQASAEMKESLPPTDSTSEVPGVDQTASAIDPATVSGYKIGETVDPSRSVPWETDEKLRPLWTAVANGESVVIGYQHNDPVFATMTMEEIVAAGHPELLIYDNNGNVIGRFIEGVPQLDRS